MGELTRNRATRTNEDTPLSGQLPAATDPDGDVVSYGLAGVAQHGLVLVNQDGTYTYSPGGDFNGTDHFAFTVFDGSGGSNMYTANVTTNPVNDSPHWVLSPADVSSNAGVVRSCRCRWW